MTRLIEINSFNSIPKLYTPGPIGDLIEYQNLNKTHTHKQKPELLICTCMDNRINLHIPDKYAFVIRLGGVNLQHSMFHISYAIATAGLRNVAIIGHNQCGMSNLNERKMEYCNGLVKYAGWDLTQAQSFFSSEADKYEIGDEIDGVLRQTIILRNKFPMVTVAPLLYMMEDNRLYCVSE